MSDRWSPDIGDASFVGWITVVGYLATALLCGRVSLASNDMSVRQRLLFATERKFWLLLALTMVLLAINKQLDLQSLFTEIGRDFAKAQGWYGERQSVQRGFIWIISIFGAVTGLIGIVMTFSARNVWLRAAVFGTVLLGTFIVVRAASFHHVDAWLMTSRHGFKYNWLLEILPIGLIAFSAWKTKSTVLQH